MTAIGLLLMVLAVCIAFVNEGTKVKLPDWIGDASAFVFGTGLTLTVVGFIIWVWKELP